ncbi:MAG: phosphate signaling complex protein PhoU [Nitriliruptoraceae bacterium]
MRQDFHADIDALVDRLVATAALCDDMLTGALDALAAPGAPGSAQVVARDNEIDTAYQSIQETVLNLFALQAPVASDLRMLAAILHANIHVERLGDYAASVARTAGRVADLDDDAQVVDTLQTMAAAATEVSRASVRSLAERDVDLARSLPQLDDAVDSRYFDVFRSIVRRAGSDEDQMEWATNMIIVARSIERYGDHAVDIGEQTIYAVTGGFVELSSSTARTTD